MGPPEGCVRQPGRGASHGSVLCTSPFSASLRYNTGLYAPRLPALLYLEGETPQEKRSHFSSVEMHNLQKKWIWKQLRALVVKKHNAVLLDFPFNKIKTKTNSLSH